MAVNEQVDTSLKLPATAKAKTASGPMAGGQGEVAMRSGAVFGCARKSLLAADFYSGPQTPHCSSRACMRSRCT